MIGTCNHPEDQRHLETVEDFTGYQTEAYVCDVCDSVIPYEIADPLMEQLEAEMSFHE